MSSFIESVVNAIHKRSHDTAVKFQCNYTAGPSLSNMNGYLRTQLGLLPINTTNERECLMDNVTEKEWLRLFSKHVAPTIVAYGLPDWK